MMHIKIHRDNQETGGSCLELRTDKTRILIDYGMPLIAKYGSEKRFDGVLISHPHQDLYDFANYLQQDHYYYLGEAAYRSINQANLLVNKDPLFRKHVFITRETPFVIGDLKIIPYWMDHSDLDTFAFLIKGDRKSIFYPGDFRGRGMRTESYKSFLRYAPRDLDYLLLEGSVPGGSDSGTPAGIPTIKEFVDTLQPKNIITIRPFEGDL